MINKRNIFILFGILMLGLLLSACQGEQESKELNLLCVPQEEWCQGMKEEFEKEFGITVNYVRMSTGEALARLEAEKDNPQFDIMWGGPIDTYIAGKNEGMFDQYESPNVENLLDKDKYLDPDNYWAGIYLGSLGFATNKDFLEANPGLEAPTSWDDLLKPEYQDQLLVAHPSTSGTSYTAMSTILQLMGEENGWDFLNEYADQVLQFTKSGSAPAKFVGAGEGAVGVVFSHDIVKQIENGLPLVLSFPEDGTGYEIGGMAIVKGAQHPDAAQKWYDWALTPEAQALGPKYKAYQAPTVGGVDLSYPELLEVNLIDYDFQWAGDNKKDFVDRFINEIAGAEDLKQ
ncbi:MAG: ABC transporter substrate-binding protein [Chloroflexi bacterium]|nr:ABC transporter substrate-binding protein [Chloroflexota bacterium]